MMMRDLLFGVILGLLAVVHSTPVSTVTQDDVYREAVTDGYLVDDFFLPALTKEPLKRNATVPPSQQPSSEPGEGAIFEGSGQGEPKYITTTSVTPQNGGEQYTTTTQSVSHAQSSSATTLRGYTDDSTSHSSTTESTQSATVSSSVSNKAPSSTTPDHISLSTLDLLGSGSGSGDGIMNEEMSINVSGRSTFMDSHYNTEVSTASSTSVTALTIQYARDMSEGSGSENGSGKTDKIVVDPAIPPSPQNTGHSTPGWIIIVGFIVGVAALIMLCVAIATRDKWNGPSQASQQETKTNSSNQQRELEMETFLHKDSPRENGKSAEYTVIPLDELPDRYSSN